MKGELFKSDGTSAGKKVDLPDGIFKVEPNDHLIYQAVVTEMTNRRSGAHSAKTRSEVRGGGTKPWRQKGTGRARAGTIRSPLWAGGGAVFPPKPHKYKRRMNKKAKRGARRSAFSYRASDNQVFVIAEPEFEEPRTKQMAAILTDMGLGEKKVLFLTGNYDKNLYLSGRNIPTLNIKKAVDASTYDVLDCEAVVITESGLEQLTGSLNIETES